MGSPHLNFETLKPRTFETLLFPAILYHVAISVTVLASGSRGNGTVLASSKTRVLIDCGLSCREICRRLATQGIAPESLSAILVTHEHSDHVSGLHVMAKKFRLPVFMNAPTHAAWQRQFKDSSGNRVHAERLELFSSGNGFSVGDIEVMPFTIPHDATDPVGFRFTAEGVRLGIATDLGFMPRNVRDHLRGCDGLILESNHDLEMLRTGPYPWVVKQRVMSRVGHLSNEALAEFLASDYDGGAAFLILAHLSEQNNHPDLARVVAERALNMRQGLWGNRLVLASQDGPLAPLTL
jgi:phosphoribosyl 1,2-cyclic phosphodiesterase